MAHSGKDLLLLEGNGADPEVFAVVGGFTSNNFSINSETVDVTTKSSNGWRTLLNQGGISSISISGSGVVENDQAQKNLTSRVLTRQIHNYQIQVPGVGDFTGPFAVASFSANGDHSGAETFDVSLESAGEITFTAI